MKHFIFHFLLIMLLISCAKEEATVVNESNLSCANDEIPLLIDKDCCELINYQSDCVILEDESINYISSESFSWLPDVCSDIGTNITFENGTEETELTIKNKSHYIIKEKLITRCDSFLAFADGTQFIQQNEFVSISVVNELFGNGPIHMELTTSILAYIDDEPGPTYDVFKIHQPEKQADISNFNFSYDLNIKRSNTLFRIFHDSIVLHDIEYFAVVEFRSIGTSTTPPDARFFINADFGFFAFEKDDVTWVRRA